MKIDEMPAGRDMDRLMHKALGRETEYRCFVDRLEGDETCVVDSDNCLVAELLNRDKKTYPNDCEHWKAVDPPEYSTNIAYSWEVIERMDELGFDSLIFLSNKETHVKFLKELFTTSESAGEAPLAICRAALKAILATDEVEVEK
jgi:hypothetical protein